MSSYNRRIKKDLNDNHTRRRAGVNTPSNRRNFFLLISFRYLVVITATPVIAGAPEAIYL